ncbi:hypothetical protein ACJX0J_024726, partial [Zea mays]
TLHVGLVTFRLNSWGLMHKLDTRMNGTSDLSNMSSKLELKLNKNHTSNLLLLFLFMLTLRSLFNILIFMPIVNIPERNYRYFLKKSIHFIPYSLHNFSRFFQSLKVRGDEIWYGIMGDHI